MIAAQFWILVGIASLFGGAMVAVYLGAKECSDDHTYQTVKIEEV